MWLSCLITSLQYSTIFDNVHEHFNLVDFKDSEDMEDEKEMNAMDDEEDDEEK